MDFGKLYKITSGNKIYVWHIIVSEEGKKVFEISSHGEDGGKIITHKKEITVAKGKKTLLEQAIQDAKRKYINKKDKECYIHSKKNLSDGSHFIVRPMLAYTFSFDDLKKRGKTIKFPCYIQPKLDGIRCISYLKDGNVIMESRKGVPFNFMDNIRTNLKKILSKNPNIYIDGEIYTDKIPFELISGIVRLKDPPSDIQKKNMSKLEYCIYDCIVKDDLDMIFKNRYKILNNLIGIPSNRKIKTLSPVP